VFLLLLGMGNFSAYQLLLNLTYSNVINFAESDFVVPGLGAQSGLTKLFGKSMSRANQASPGFETEVMRWLQKNQDEHFKRLGLEFSGLGPDRLPMQLCDIEHTLCEVDKYARLSHPHIAGLHGRTHLKQSFKQSALFYPEFHIPKAWAHPDRKTVRIRPGPPRKVNKIYVIHSIVGRRKKASGVQYKVHWWGYSSDDDTWEPEKELKEDAPEVIEAYLASIA
jgi:alpha-glutamyl/putrescinyl thymine pyrophosphorylase clade 1/Chromo (CHRromatin Organisation MOdifier) domain